MRCENWIDQSILSLKVNFIKDILHYLYIKRLNFASFFLIIKLLPADIYSFIHVIVHFSLNAYDPETCKELNVNWFE